MRTVPLLALLLLTACVPTQPLFDWPRDPLTDAERADLFANIGPAQRDSYGYAPEDAVRIGRFGPFKGMRASAEMISHLRKDGQRLRVLGRSSRHTLRPDSSTASQAPYGAPSEGTIVDGYVVVSESGADTLLLYFDPYYSSPLHAPSGLEWSVGP